jgi:ATP-dependent helicase/nuclease subunit A
MAEVLQFREVVKRVDEGDAAARVRALDTRASCIVEAPAGSGKTGLLVQRYLKLLADEGVDEPEEVLAITFTNKATAELRERVLGELQAAARCEALGVGAKQFDCETRALASAAVERGEGRGWGLVEQPQRLNIRSIDSVCAEIANALPLLSGGGGAREPVTEAMPLYRMAARRTLLQLGGGDAGLHGALRTVLLHRDGSVADVETLLAEMLQTREQWGELVPLGPGELDEATLDREVRLKLERSLEGVVCAGLTRALRAMPAGMLEELTAMAARMGLSPGYKGGESPITVCVGRHESPAAAEHLEHWVALVGLVIKPKEKERSKAWRASFSANHIGFEITKGDAARLKSLVQEVQSDELCEALCGVLELPPAKYPDDQWDVAKALFRVLRRALAELRVLFAERGECDFAEFALAARSALRAEEGATDVALSEGGKLRHLLVDEMQDTSSGQYELLELLTRTWDGHTQTLFLVGDPKQSIYLFRQARVERFLRTMREGRLGEIRLQALQLTANFRSQARLVGDFNGMFERVFPRADEVMESEALDVPFVAASAVREETEGLGIAWHAAVFEDEAGGHGALEAREVRRVIEERLRMDLPEGREEPWRIAVLGRAREHLAAVIAELKRDDGDGAVPYRAVDLDPLDELPEVLDALALTRALLHPADRVAWLAVLHAPWCGLGLADMLRLTGEGEEDDATATVAGLVAGRRGLLSAEGRALLDRAWPVLETAMAGVGRTSLAVHVERTWRSLGGDVALGAEARGNVGRYLEVLREVEGGGDGVDVQVLGARLKNLYAEPGSGAVGGGIVPVDLMTIHKAKGLEWDVVLVPGLERKVGGAGSVLLNWLEFDGAEDGDGASVVLAPIWSKGTERDKLSGWLSGVRRKREAAERKRVVYVASTRAKEELHLFGAVGRKVNGELAGPRYGSLLGAIWPAVKDRFEALNAGAGGAMVKQLMDSLRVEDEGEYEGLALAAAAEGEAGLGRVMARVERLPVGFDPGARFREAEGRRLAYPAAAELRRTAVFERPEGSFAVRAFGNVVHRYLQVVAARLEGVVGVEALVAELPSWQARLMASLRGEGLSPELAAREAVRALRALTLTMGDPVGRWILSPRSTAASERALVMEDARSLRVDRTFVAGDAVLSEGDGCIWIVDFKTTEKGSRGDEAFAEAERAKYRAQMEAYAALRRGMVGGGLPIRLGLYYPLGAGLVWWESGEE